MMLKYLLFSTILLISFNSQATDRALLSPDRVNKISAGELFTDSVAFVSGVSEYNDNWADLPGVERDIDAVVSLLYSKGFKIEKSLNNTKREFENNFDTFLRRYAYNDRGRIVIYFAGHGHTLKANSGKEGYIVFKDAGNPKISKEKFISGSVPMSFFAEKAKEIKANQVLFAFDSCFSGSVFSTMRSIPELIIEILNKPVRQFISSGTENQLVPDDSVFRRRFIDGVNGSADSNQDRVITGSELGQYLQSKVSAYTEGTQTPAFGKMAGYEGEFVFINKDFDVREGEEADPHSSEKEKLIAIIKKNPYSPNATKALIRLREIYESLQNNPPVMQPERKNLKMSAKSVKRTKTSSDENFNMIIPASFSSMIGDYKVVFKIKAKDKQSFKKLNERKYMLKSVMSRRLNESNLQLIDNVVRMRERLRESSTEAVEWVCPGCIDQKPVIAGLMGL
ncbi:MAG: hypothetical protein C0603_13240 [Denitrovibrio sp.]|nr:MAG: hypothetical protein C0603_13240 [Denitrovibrio sp.]